MSLVVDCFYVLSIPCMYEKCAVDTRPCVVFKCFPNANLLQHFLKMPAACEPVLEDIEDIVSAEDVKPHDRQFVRRNVFPKVRKRNSQKNLQTDDEPPSDR